jgi:nucleotide-binding universal stress UspA family protein
MHGTIVCGVTEATESHAAAQLAAALAARLGLRLLLVHVVTGERPSGHRGETETHGRVGSERPLETAAQELCADAEVRIVVGNRVDGLAQVAAEEGADVIVLGSRPRGARGRQLRCTLARELEAATVVPVLIAPPATRERSGRRLTLAGQAAVR